MIDPRELVPGDLVAAQIAGVWALTRVRGATLDPSCAAVLRLAGVDRVVTEAGMVRAADLAWPSGDLPWHPERRPDLDSEPRRVVRRAAAETPSKRAGRERGYTREP